jgi:hypothetical protein
MLENDINNQGIKMKKLLILFFAFSLSTSLLAGEIFRIEIGKDYNKYSDNDLKRRVWELERAVWQLQQKVFELEMSKTQAPTAQATWICKTEAMGRKFSATGSSKAIAENEVMEKCKADPTSANGFHCEDARCSQ